MSHNSVVNHGMTQTLTGLGILCGAGVLSLSAHKKIIDLISKGDGDDDGPDPVDNNDSVKAKDSASQCLSWGPSYYDSSAFSTQRPHESHAQTTPSVDPPGAWVDSSEDRKIICPWWSTSGYQCKNHDDGGCPMYHEDIKGGWKDPLICYFWKNGDRCKNRGPGCRFAHYHAAHGVVAPCPVKKPGSVVEEWIGQPSSTTTERLSLSVSRTGRASPFL